MSSTSLLPLNESDTAKVIDVAYESKLNQFYEHLSVLKDFANPDLCPEEFLVYLAYSYNVDFWEDDLPVSVKRALIKQSILLHRYKGTVWAVEEVLKLLNLASDEEPAVITEGLCIKYDGAHKYDGIYTYGDKTKWPYYVIELKQPVSIQSAQLAQRAVAVYAPKRCRLHAITYSKLNTYDGSIKYDGTYTYGVIGADKL